MQWMLTLNFKDFSFKSEKFDLEGEFRWIPDIDDSKKLLKSAVNKNKAK